MGNFAKNQAKIEKFIDCPKLAIPEMVKL